MSARSIPSDTPIRVVGDVHGDAVAFAYAAATDRFVVQLGDLTDYGPDNAEALRIMFRLIDQGRGLFLLGNHDLKLARFLAGHGVRNESTLDATLAQLDDGLRERVVAEVAIAPAWLHRGRALFVHGGFHTVMTDQAAPEHGLQRPHGALARALYGEYGIRVQDMERDFPIQVSATGQRKFTGTSVLRSSSSGACKLRARVTARPSRESSSMRGTRPTVLTVIERCESPAPCGCGSVSRRTAATTDR